MSLNLTREQVLRFRTMPRDEQEEFLSGMSAAELLALDAAFEMWAQDGQGEPGGEGWRVWLMLAGRGFGKTRAGAEWVMRMAKTKPMRIALVGASIDDARGVMVEGASGILTLSRMRKERVKFEAGQGRLSWPNGSIATLYSGDHPDGLRGPEHHVAWCDELAKWRRVDMAWANLQMGLRGGARPRALVTTTPKPLRALDVIRADPLTVETGGRTMDNVTLPKNFIAAMIATYGGTRLGRQELDGELFAEAEGSLFPRALLDEMRCELPPREAFDRVVVAVDPPASATGDACGIVVAGRIAETIYVIEDSSVEKAGPEAWARAVANAAARWDASHVVAEANNGGDMVVSVLKAADSALRVKKVHASRGKVARAEPVAIRMERGLAKLAGIFPALEAELGGMVQGGGYDGGGSPDRADAMVWAVTELSETKSGVPRVRAL